MGMAASINMWLLQGFETATYILSQKLHMHVLGENEFDRKSPKCYICIIEENINEHFSW